METIRNFSEAQVADMKRMVFGSVLDRELNHISTHLGFWLVRNFDEQFDVLNIGNHRIKITSDLVYEVFGIPKGSKPIVTVAMNKDPEDGYSIMD
ncbi:hypothetical protein Hanom_Chr14g01249631 [Helianthus anomalus]